VDRHRLRKGGFSGDPRHSAMTAARRAGFMTPPNVTKVQKVTTRYQSSGSGRQARKKGEKVNGSSERRASTPKTLSAIMRT
jgi:hypothetical protein